MSGIENHYSSSNNRSLIAVSNADNSSTVELWADPTTHALIVSGGGGGGSGTQYAEGNTTSPATGTLSMGRYNATPPSLTNGQLYGLQLDANGNLKTTGGTAANGIVSAANSSTATLGIAGVFTGTSEDVSNYSAIQVSVISDVASATDGLAIQQSSNGTNWDLADNYTILANTGKVFSIQPSARYLRIVYTNGGTAQTSFRLQTVYHVIAPNPSSQRPADAYTNETDMTQNWSFNSIWNGTAWDRMKSIATGIQGVGINDGTNTANVLKSDGSAAGQNAQITAGAFREINGTSASSLNADLIPSTDVSSYKWLSLHITGVAVGTLTFQGSNDNFATNVVNIPLNRLSVTTATPVSSTTVSDIYAGPVQFRYFRVRQTAYTSGTSTGVLELYTMPTAAVTIGGQVSLNGTTIVAPNSTVGSAVPTTAYYTGLNNSGNSAGWVSLNGTGDATSGTAIGAIGPWIYNGSTWDRARSIAGAAATTGTGITASGSMGLGKTANPTAVTDGQYVPHLTDKLGKQVVVNSIRDLKADAALTLTSSTTETTLIAAIASTFNDLYGLIITNTSATACEVIFRDVAAGTPRFSFQVPAGDTRGFMLSESGAYKQATVNTAWTAQCSTSVASIKINAMYVKNT